MKRFVVFMLAGIVAGGCANKSAPDTRAADADAIRAVLAEANKDFAAHNFDGALKLYADDAALFVPGSGIIQGIDGVRTALTAGFSDPNSKISITPTKVEVARSGELAYAYGTGLTVTTDPATGKTTRQASKWVTVFKKQADGSWQAVADIFNNDSAPAE
jgi:uncharacterized protein (TIGR02246 family)